MNLEQYRSAREERSRREKAPRQYCVDCKKPRATCYCRHITPFEPSSQFVILIHRDEARRSVATGRMAHLCLSNSLLFEGLDFSHHEEINRIIGDPANHAVVLYPGEAGTDLSALSSRDRERLIPAGKRLVVFVLDGTWAQARRMRRLSENLKPLPMIYFTPSVPSGFVVRKQPRPECYATIEAIHCLIGLLGPDPAPARETLLRAFTYMVDQQIDYEARLGYRKRPRRK